MGDARYARAPGVIETDLGTELVLLDPATQEMFSLNPSGRLVWQSLPGTAEQAGARLREAYGIAEEDARRDAAGLLDDLAAAGLLTQGDGDAA